MLAAGASVHAEKRHQTFRAPATRALRLFAALLTFRGVQVEAPRAPSPPSETQARQAGIGEKVGGDDFVAFQAAKLSPECQQEQVLTEGR
jgi:hypothetical protein